MTTLDEIEDRAIAANAAMDKYGMGDLGTLATMARMTATVEDAPKMCAVIRKVESVINALDDARTTGSIWTYGQVQRALRDAIEEGLTT